MRKDMTLRDLLPTLAVSAVVSWCGAAGTSYVLGQGEAAFGPLVVAVITLVGTVFFSSVSIWVMLAYDGYLAKPPTANRSVAAGATPASAEADEEDHGNAPRHAPGSMKQRIGAIAARLSRITRLTPQWSRRSILKFCLVMAVFWLPWLIANYPGGAYWDTYYQIQQCFPENHPISIVPFGNHAKDTLTGAYFCDHHPLLDTLIYGGFAMASQALTGAWNLGSFAFVILQGAATIVALTAGLAYLRKLGAPRTLCFIAYVYFCLMPFISTWALTMVKDSLFSLVYIPYFMMLLAAVASRGASLERPRSVALFIGLGILLCLTKKTGIYVVLPTALVMFVVLAWKNRERLRSLGAAFGGQAVACVLVMQLLMPSVVFPLLDVAPGGAQESLGLPLQQTAAFVHAYHDEVTPEERADIDAIIPYHKVEEEYDPTCQDAVKYWFRQNSTPEEVQAYLRTWAAMGLRHPEVYLAATLSIGGTYLAPVRSLNIRTTTCDTWQGTVHVLYNPEQLNWLREGMANLYNGYAETPVACLPVQAVVWSFWLPALLLIVAWRFRPRDIALFVPGAIVLAFCVIGPIFDARYCLPLLYTVPLLACFVFRKEPEGVQPEKGSSVAPENERKGEADDSSDASGGDNHGIDLGHGRDAAVHGPVG